MQKYHGAREGYEPPDVVQQEIDVRDLPKNLSMTDEERKARRTKNEERERSRARHRKRKGHGR